MTSQQVSRSAPFSMSAPGWHTGHITVMATTGLLSGLTTVMTEATSCPLFRYTFVLRTLLWNLCSYEEILFSVPLSGCKDLCLISVLRIPSSTPSQYLWSPHLEAIFIAGSACKVFAEQRRAALLVVTIHSCQTPIQLGKADPDTMQLKHVWITASVLPFLATPAFARCWHRMGFSLNHPSDSMTASYSHVFLRCLSEIQGTSSFPISVPSDSQMSSFSGQGLSSWACFRPNVCACTECF